MLRKAFVSITLCAVLLMSPFVGLKVNALSADSISAPSAVLMESSTGKVLFEKNPHEQRPCASVTKVMTLLLVFEAVDSGKLSLDDEITASEHAAGMGGSDIWLEKGETMSADDMIKATVVVSANDAAVALAEHISGSEDAFVEKMNSRAKELGMNDTVFKNCNGLADDSDNRILLYICRNIVEYNFVTVGKCDILSLCTVERNIFFACDFFDNRTFIKDVQHTGSCGKGVLQCTAEICKCNNRAE